MKVDIKKEVYTKTIETVRSVEFPEEKRFYFQTGIRRSIAMIPIWTTWNQERFQKPEEIYEYKFIMVYNSFEAKVETYNVSVKNLSEYDLSKDSYKAELLDFIINNENTRTEEQFTADLNSVLDKLKLEVDC